MSADIEIAVEVDLDGTGTLVDISDRIRSIRGRYGRHQGIHDYETGRCRIKLHSDDNFLTPGGGSEYQTDRVHGGECKITATIGSTTLPIFSGFVDDLIWKGDSNTAIVTLIIVDGFSRLSHALVHAELPAERTGERADRILDLAKYPSDPGDRLIDDGTIYCAATSVDSTALELLRRCAATEGGRLDIVHTGDEPGAIEFRARELIGGVDITITDDPDDDSTDLQPSSEPETGQDPDLLANRVEFKLASGDVITAEDTASEERYGIRTHTQDVFGGREDTQALADWWIDLYSHSYFRVRSVTIAAHFETDIAAIAALQTTVGNVAHLDYIPAGGDQRVQARSTVDGIEFSIKPLSPADTASQVDFRWALSPSESSAYWQIGDSYSGILGSTTRITAPSSSADIDRPRDRPSGRVRWSDGDFVSVNDFTGGLTSQVITCYASEIGRTQGEQRPEIGQLNSIADPNIADDETAVANLTVWTGRKFTSLLRLLPPGLQSSSSQADDPNPSKPDLTLTSTGRSVPIVAAWTYDDPNDSAQQEIALRRKTYRVEATTEGESDPNDPLVSVTRIRYKASASGGWGPNIANSIAVLADSRSFGIWPWHPFHAPSPVRIAIKVKNADGDWSAWSDDEVADPRLTTSHSPIIELSAPTSSAADEELELSWTYSDGDSDDQARWFLWRIIAGASFVWDGESFALDQSGISDDATSVTIPASWGLADGDDVRYFLIVEDVSGHRSLPDTVVISPT